MIENPDVFPGPPGEGLSLLDYFAGQALIAIGSNGNVEDELNVALLAWKQAVAMLKLRSAAIKNLEYPQPERKA
jgi:hypothetical protein